MCGEGRVFFIKERDDGLNSYKHIWGKDKWLWVHWVIMVSGFGFGFWVINASNAIM